MTARSVARQYGHAAFAVAQKTGQAAELGRELQGFAELVAGHAELALVLESATVPKHIKKEVVTALLERTGPVTGELRRLLELLADNDRLGLVPEIVESYAERMMDAEGVVTAELTTVQPLDEARLAALAQALGRVTGRRVDVSGQIDESIIGGVIARVGGVVYDGSVARQLERMRLRLVADA